MHLLNSWWHHVLLRCPSISHGERRPTTTTATAARVLNLYLPVTGGDTQLAMAVIFVDLGCKLLFHQVFRLLLLGTPVTGL